MFHHIIEGPQSPARSAIDRRVLTSSSPDSGAELKLVLTGLESVSHFSYPDDVTIGGNIPISCCTEVVEVKVQVVHTDVTEVSLDAETSSPTSPTKFTS